MRVLGKTVYDDMRRLEGIVANSDTGPDCQWAVQVLPSRHQAGTDAGGSVVVGSVRLARGFHVVDVRVGPGVEYAHRFAEAST